MKIFCYIATLIIATACGSSRDGTATSDYARMYSSNKQVIQVDFKLYHQQTDSTIIYFKVDSKSLLYTRTSQASPFKANFNVGYELSDPGSKLIIDSASFNFSDIKNNSDEGGDIEGRIALATRQSTDLKIKVYMKDNNRFNENVLYTNLNQTNPYHLQNFLIKDFSGHFFRSNIINTPDSFSIESNTFKPDHFFVQHFPIHKSLAPPPFSGKSGESDDFMPHSTQKTPFNGSTNLQLDSKGIYLFKTDTNNAKGFILLRFNEDFPRISNAQSFYEPLQYITSKDEFSAITSHDNPKKAAEDFWLKSAGDKDIARASIKAFYSRVEEANTYFTTYKEGWMTDRGLILIIFGPPERVVKQFKREIWYYGFDISVPNLVCNFKLIDNKFSNNVYELERSIGFKPIWYRAQDSWRDGRPFYVR